MNYKLQENNAGGMLLTVTGEEETLMLYTDNPADMGEYLAAQREGTSMDTLRDMAAYGAEVDDHETYAEEWAVCPVIADNAGEYRDMAGVSGSKALQLAGLRKAPIAELERCQTAEEVSELATEYEELVSADLTGYKLHERAWWVCRTMWDKAQPENYDELRSLVWLWEDVCKALVGAEALSIDAYKTYEEGELEICNYEQADTVELRAERVSLRGLHPYDLAGNMAHWCEDVLGERYDYESDGDIEWYTFKK